MEFFKLLYGIGEKKEVQTTTVSLGTATTQLLAIAARRVPSQRF